MSLLINSEVGRLADQLERSFHTGAPGTAPPPGRLSRGIDAPTARQRPDGSRHTIVNIVRHITFWLNAANLRIAGGRDVDPESDWPEDGELTDEAWTRVVAELEQAHAKLHTRAPRPR